MSDKSFGDYTSRNIVKNPLLSTAVTGLSIEDLTHNAVLLPAIPSQELNTRQDKTGVQMSTLRDSQNTSEFQAGDAFSSITQHDIITLASTEITDSQKHAQTIKSHETSTVSNALKKSEDEFDVNTYFARLQGSRYVSAPLNSCLKEDQNANLQSDESLEEVNLNEPDRSSADEVQHSLTSDIAQNFSQLPTVLPQVASAVFNSFSNMLSMKSREQTPDDVRPSVQMERQDNFTVPLSVPDGPVKDCAPPALKEPPISGISNYRITTKKKVYAQIPGLSYGDTNVQTYSQPPVQAPPSYLIPDNTTQEAINFFNTDYNAAVNKPEEIHKEPNNYKSQDKKQDYNIFVPKDTDVVVNEESQFQNVVTQDYLKSDNQYAQQNPVSQPTHVNKAPIPYKRPVQGTTPIIPPPPMFSSLPRTDQTPVEKTILPPSVARRIAANQPVIKKQVPLNMPVHDIFVPTMVETPEIADETTIYNTLPISGQNVSKEIPSNDSARLSVRDPGYVRTDINEVMSLPSEPYTANSPEQVLNLQMSTTMSVPEMSLFEPLPTKNLYTPLNFQSSNLSATKSTVESQEKVSLSDIPNELSDFSINNTTVDSFQQQKLESHPIAPLFFNLNEPSQSATALKETIIPSTSDSKFSEHFTSKTSEAQKPIGEPPKVSNNLSYRMTKKRPQYYSGPIDGVGIICSNVKPLINPIEPPNFQGSLFTPVQEIVSKSQNVTSDYSTPMESAVPYDITNLANLPPAPFDLKQQQQSLPDFNTVFDLSRPTTEQYEPPPQDSKGFGIIGSLKSKLSSIDINRIQNTVTTFFDPAYNNAKIDPQSQLATQQQNLSTPYIQSKGNLEIFVPNVEPTQKYAYDDPINYDKISGHANQYYPSQDFQHCNVPQTQSQHYSTLSSYPSYQNLLPDLSVPDNLALEEEIVMKSIIESTEKIVEESPLPFFTKNTNIEKISPRLPPLGSSHMSTTTAVPLKSFSDNQKAIVNQQPNVVNEKFNQVKATGMEKILESSGLNLSKTDVDLAQKYATDSKQMTNNEPLRPDFFGLQKNETKSVLEVFNSEDVDLNASSEYSLVTNQAPISRFFDTKKQDTSISGPSTESSFFKTIAKDTTEINYQTLQSVKETNRPLDSFCNEASDGIPSVKSLGDFTSPILPAVSSQTTGVIGFEGVGMNLFDRTDEATFHIPGTSDDNIEKIVPGDTLENQVSELSICETCREVNKTEPEEKDVDDLTIKLIENIIAPIQLLNPVEVPLPEASITLIDPVKMTNQFIEVSRAPADTIENIDIASVVELLDDTNVPLPYGWSTNDGFASQISLDHNYSNQPDANAIGFFQNKSSILESIPTNASDEIKAEYRNSQEDVTILSRQLSIPTAPPEEDTKSDESCLDVHSIEQDAKNDFPLFEEFVIEPSETDDDKIEFRERTKSTDEPTQEADTFTNRVERYKKLETAIDSMDDVFDIQRDIKPVEVPTSSSPAITIASYFDTGNYAAETHYKNSLNSTATRQLQGDKTMLFPPGFEEEYQRRYSAASLQDFVPNVQFIPETSTQTHTITTLSFSQPFKSEDDTIGDTNIINMIKDLVVEDTLLDNERSPALSNIVSSNEEKIFAENTELKETDISATEVPKEKLPDPMTFFSANVEASKESDVYSDFQRLSSYFTTPTQADHSKSFFELSQSQNHYRKSIPEKADSIKSNVKSFFQTQDSAGIINSRETQNIPQNYSSNMDLVRDLASFKTFTPNEDVVTTVGYFTVEYDFKNDSIGKPEADIKTEKLEDSKYNDQNHKIGKPETNLKTDKLKDFQNIEHNKQLGDTKYVNSNENIIRNCKYCCNPTIVRHVCRESIKMKDFKVRKVMDDSRNNKDSDIKMDSKSEVGRRPVAVNFMDQTLQDGQDDEVSVTVEDRASSEYGPVKHHWFYRVDSEGKSIWRGFSVADSNALENAFNSDDLDENTLVATDGGRFDVNVMGRLRTAVYWTDKPTNVRRCSWFYKGTTDARYVPYTEVVAEKLEEEYSHGIRTGEWHRRLMLPNNESVVMHGPAVMVHFLQNTASDAFSTAPLFSFGKRVYRNPPKIRVSEDQPEKIDHLLLLVHGAGEHRHQKEKIQSMRPRVVRRGCVESEIEDTEPSSIDHLLLLCHGVGSVCDMHFRSVEEVVNDFRTTSLRLTQSHYKNSCDSGLVGRVEVLPIAWHSSLHSTETGVDRRLAAVTLDSIPWLRSFTNDTILDVLFYTSPVYCQTIIDTVCGELNRIYTLFKSRNPDFKGGISLGGHSLGSVILYDILGHQLPPGSSGFPDKNYVTGPAGTGQPSVKYPSLMFSPDSLYALGSPIAIFECIRGVETLGQNFSLPNCKNFFNIFHPYDPIAYRIEPLIDPVLRDVKPFLIPHHKGRKRMHLELKDTMARFGADIKQRLVESIKSTWSSMWKSQPPPTDQQLEKVVEEEMEKEPLTDEPKEEQANEVQAAPESLGRLNGGRRVDYVLQEAPFEMINEYLFAMSSHVCYWESEDTMLLILREIYDSVGVRPDCSVPQQNLTVQRTRSVQENRPVSPFTETASTSRHAS